MRLKLSRVRLWLAGLLAALVGMPLSEQAFGQPGDIVRSSLGLADSIADSAGQS